MTPKLLDKKSSEPEQNTASETDRSRADGTQAEYTYRFSENTSVTLDLIRAISAQMVVVGHGISFLQIALWLHEPNFPWIQNIGVLVFFLLSGLLITQSTFAKKDRKGYDFKTFFIERFSRIYSGYVPAMCLVVALDFLFISLYGKTSYPYSLDLKAFLGNLFMLQDFPLCQSQIGVTSLGSARPFWTLAVEWWIYMFFGCVVLSKSFAKHKAIFVSILAVSTVVPFYNSVIAGRGNGLFLVWMMGLLVALLLNGTTKNGTTINQTTKNLSPRKCAVLFAALLTCACARTYMIKSAYDLIFAALLMGALYFMARGLDAVGPIYNATARRLIKFTADYSFSLYLIHYSIFYLLAPQVVNLSPYALFAIGFVGSNLVAAMIALVTEMRHKQLAKHLIAKLDGSQQNLIIRG